MALQQLATCLRALQLYAHHAHNNCRGKSFFQDHAFLGDVYAAAEADYDDVIERIIGTSDKPLNTLEIAADAVKLAQQCPKEAGDCNSNFLQGILRLELSICIYIDRCIAAGNLPEGTRQLIGNIADKSMSRQYKLRQRIQG